MTGQPSLTPISKNPPSPDAFPVILVEDDPAIARLIRTILGAAGYVVSHFGSAEELLEKVAGYESPILLVDVNLPGISGLELLEQLVGVREDFEVIVITAHADVESLSRAIELGIFSCVAKPFANEELKVAVAGAANRLFLRLDRRAQTEALRLQNRELERALAQLQESESRRVLSERLASIGRFAASLAHEINNPLAYVQTNVSVLQESATDLAAALGQLMNGTTWAELDPEVAQNAAQLGFELHGILDECVTGLSLMRRISNDLSSVARYGTEREEVFDFNDVVRTACRVASIERLRAKLDLQLTEDRVNVRGSTGRLAQVVMNLVGNAAEAADVAAGRPNVVTVRTRKVDDRVELEVADTGIGLTGEQRGNIFEPFVTYRVGGHGIGLSLVREIVSECGGEIAVESKPGIGTAFKVRLPMERVASKQTTPGSALRLPVGVELLIVDDDPLVRSAYARAFRGHKLRFAENGSFALHEIMQKRPDLVISDLQMPEMDGMALYESIAQRWPELRHRIVFVTGTDSFAEMAHQLAPQCPLVRKPFQVRDLEHKLATLLR